jgi:cyclase
MEFVRVIPCLDIKGGRVVKGVHFLNLRDAADPVEAAQGYSEGGADEIAFLDITATVERRRTMFDVLRRVHRDPELVKGAVERFGSERIIIAIDADVNESLPSKREVYVDGGRTATGADAVEFARRMADLGVGRILPTSKAADGTKDGYDLALTRGIADATGLPVIASGGAGKLEHFYDAVAEGGAQAVLAASVFHFGEFTIREVKQYLRSRKLPVRI